MPRRGLLELLLHLSSRSVNGLSFVIDRDSDEIYNMLVAEYPDCWEWPHAAEGYLKLNLMVDGVTISVSFAQAAVAR